MQALQRFGFASIGLTPEDFQKTDAIIQLGIDLPGSTSLPVYSLSRRLLRRNKRAAGRTIDLADLEDIPEE
jgi:hypothetical protein